MAEEASAPAPAPVPEKKKAPKRPTVPRKAPGHILVKNERDRLLRAIAMIERRLEKRNTDGKTAPSICGILNERVRGFYQRALVEFDKEFPL